MREAGGRAWDSVPRTQNAKAVRTSCCRVTVKGGDGDQVDLMSTGRELTPGRLASPNPAPSDFAHILKAETDSDPELDTMSFPTGLPSL